MGWRRGKGGRGVRLGCGGGGRVRVGVGEG